MITRKIVGSRMSKIVEHNGVIYFAGIVPNDKTLDVKGQTLDVLNIAKELFEKSCNGGDQYGCNNYKNIKWIRFLVLDIVLQQS